LIALLAASIAASGCSIGATAAPVIPLTAPVPMTVLPPITEPPAPTTTTVPPDTAPPVVETTISSGDVVDWYRGDISVSTESGAELTIDGEPVQLDGDGSVTLPIINAPGVNSIVITVSDGAGNTAEEIVVYNFDPPEGWIATIGDSIMLGAKEEIEGRFGNDIVDATVSRQFLDAPVLVRNLVRRASPPQVIVIGLGTNGPAQARHFDEVMEIIGPDTLVAFINVRVPRSWEATTNNELAAGVERYENAILIDWFAAADDHRELFAGDGFHPSQAGRVVLVDLIAAAIVPVRESEESSDPTAPVSLDVRS
jgi:lysophospholipase L1-like esterase